MTASCPRRAALACFALVTALPTDARAGGLTFLSDDPALVLAMAGPAGSGGAAGEELTVDGTFGIDGGNRRSVATWTLSPSHLELAVDQRSGDEWPFPIEECRLQATFVLTVDAPQTYTISGQYAFRPDTTGQVLRAALGAVIVDLTDATSGTRLVANSYTSDSVTSGTFVLGEPSESGTTALEGSLVGTLVPGHVYHFSAWVQTIPEGSPGYLGEALFRLDAAPVDSDADGLPDVLEADLGTDPEVPDTDGDGLLDGEEHALGGGVCPDLLVADSDGDTLLDGAEVGAGTSACDADSDDDGAPDAYDPSPTVPGATTAQLVALAEQVAAGLADTPLSGIVAPTPRSAAQRRATLVARVEDAAAAIEAGDAAEASELLASVRVRLDGAPVPADWLVPSAEQAVLLAQVDALLALLE